jgi:hypothetical protein
MTVKITARSEYRYEYNIVKDLVCASIYITALFDENANFKISWGVISITLRSFYIVTRTEKLFIPIT